MSEESQQPRTAAMLRAEIVAQIEEKFYTDDGLDAFMALVDEYAARPGSASPEPPPASDENYSLPTIAGAQFGLAMEELDNDVGYVWRLCSEDDTYWHRKDVTFHPLWLHDLIDVCQRALRARGSQGEATDQ